jgi:hypothetical protein
VHHQVNLRGAKKHHDVTHDTIRDMMATSSHVFSSISRGGTKWVYGGRLFTVSARMNKRHHHHHRGVSGPVLYRPLQTGRCRPTGGCLHRPVPGLDPKIDDDDDLLFVLAETTNSLPLYTHLGTPSRYRRKARVMMLLSCFLWYHDASVHR